MASESRINLRIPPALRTRIEALATEHGITISQACRILLNAALREDTAQIAVEEAITAFAAVRSKLVRQLMSRTSQIFTELLAEEMGVVDAE